MHFLILKDDKVSVGWNPKCGCTGILYNIFVNKYGYTQFKNDIHSTWKYRDIWNDKLEWWDKRSCIESKFLKNINILDYKFYGVYRDPIERFISTFYDVIIRRKKYSDENEIIDDYINKLIDDSFDIDKHHFCFQFNRQLGIFNFLFDEIYELKDMELFLSKIGIENDRSAEANNIIGHLNNYSNDDEFIGNKTIKYLIDSKKFVKDIKNLIKKDTIERLYNYYKYDFEVISFYKNKKNVQSNIINFNKYINRIKIKEIPINISQIDFEIKYLIEDVKKIITNNKPAIINRIGGSDFDFFNLVFKNNSLNLLGMKSNIEIVYKFNGYFDTTTDESIEKTNLNRYYNSALDSYRSSDLFICVGQDLLDDINMVYYEGSIKKYNPNQKYTITNILPKKNIHYNSFEFINFKTSDSLISFVELLKLFEGKKILVVSPFADEIKLQFPKKDSLFTNFPLLKNFKYPDFDLLTLKCPITYSNYKDRLNTNYYDYKNWFEVCESISNKISQIEFNIALLSCGSYSLPLLNDIKNKYKKIGIYMGGVLQIFFGIRADRYKIYDQLGWTNENWIDITNVKIPSCIINNDDNNIDKIARKSKEGIYAYTTKSLTKIN